MYLYYDEYATMGGLTISAADYPRREYAARRFVDRITHGRLVSEAPVRDCVKALMFELVELDDNSAGNVSAVGVSSVSNDGVSISYSQTGRADLDRARSALACEYLAGEMDADGVCLLYAGVQG